MNREIEKIAESAERSEKSIERYLCRRVKDLGGICLKYANPGMIGFPDRVALLPGGRTIWIELKSAGTRLRRTQAIRKAQMEAIGHPVHIADSRKAVDEILEGNDL